MANGIPFINAGHIRRDGSLSADTMHYITREKFNSLRDGKIQKDDLLYCLRGTLGKTAFVEPYEEGAVASSLVIIRTNPEILAKQFAYYFLASPYGQDLISRFDNGSAQPNLSADSVRRYVVPLPPHDEQHEIIRRLNALLSWLSPSKSESLMQVHALRS
jgi:type I restriction enzyme, S subunit